MDKETDLLERDEEFISEAMKIRFFPFVMDSQEGSTITHVDGDEFIDFNASWAVANTGYQHPSVRERIETQLEKSFTNSPLSIPHKPVIRLAERLCNLDPFDFSTKVWFGHSGSEAGELVSKAIPAEGEGDTILTFEGSYHGITTGAATISGHNALQGISADNVVTLPFPNQFREDCSADRLAEKSLEHVQSAFETHDVAGLITEPIQSDSGILVPPPGFLEGLANLCADNNSYFVIDEVKTGMGRTGKMFGFQHSDVVPDAIMLGKPLGSGLPISAVVGREELVDFQPAGHMMTTAANPLSVAAALGTLDVIEKEELPAKAKHMGKRLEERLQEIANRSAIIGDVRGRGLIQGLEIVTPNGSEPDPDLTAKIVLWARKHRLIQFYVGMESNVLEITPPLTISEEKLDEGCARLAAALTDAQSNTLDDQLLEQYAGW